MMHAAGLQCLSLVAMLWPGREAIRFLYMHNSSICWGAAAADSTIWTSLCMLQVLDVMFDDHGIHERRAEQMQHPPLTCPQLLTPSHLPCGMHVLYSTYVQHFHLGQAHTHMHHLRREDDGPSRDHDSTNSGGGDVFVTFVIYLVLPSRAPQEVCRVMIPHVEYCTVLYRALPTPGK